VKSTELLQREVTDELAWDPTVDSSAIAVTIQHNIATLAGRVLTASEKLAAEAAAQRVAGIAGVIDKIQVSADSPAPEADYEIIRGARAALESDARIPHKVINNLAVSPETPVATIRNELLAAFRRDADSDAGRIDIKVDSGCVTLTGRVRSWRQRRIAHIAAAHVPGITEVCNELTVDVPVGVLT